MSETGGMEAGAGEASTGDEGFETEGKESQAGVAGSSKGLSGQSQASLKAEVMAELGESDMDRMVTLKVDGKEEKMTVREALKVSRLERASQAKMQEAAQVQRQAQQLLQVAKSDPKQFFKMTGMDPYEFAESTLAEKYEMMQLSPQERELREYKAREVEQKKQNEEYQKQTQARQFQEQTSKVQGELDKEIGEAWKESGLPSDKYFAARIASEMLSSLAQKKAGYREDTLQAKDAAAIVKAKYQAETRQVLQSIGKTNPAQLQEILGNDILKILRDYDVKRVTGKSASSQGSQSNRPPNGASGQKANASKALGEREWADFWKKL